MEDVGKNMHANGESGQVAKGRTLEGNDLLCGGRKAQIEHSKVSVETGRLRKGGIRQKKRPKKSRGAER